LGIDPVIRFGLSGKENKIMALEKEPSNVVGVCAVLGAIVGSTICVFLQWQVSHNLNQLIISGCTGALMGYVVGGLAGIILS